MISTPADQPVGERPARNALRIRVQRAGGESAPEARQGRSLYAACNPANASSQWDERRRLGDSSAGVWGSPPCASATRRGRPSRRRTSQDGTTGSHRESVGYARDRLTVAQSYKRKEPADEEGYTTRGAGCRLGEDRGSGGGARG